MLRGRCACNAVAYEIPDEFVNAYFCHCSNCRALTGSAFLPVGRIEREKLTVTKGADSLLVDGDEPTLKPMYHQFVGSKASWYEIQDDLPQHDERAPS